MHACILYSNQYSTWPVILVINYFLDASVCFFRLQLKIIALKKNRCTSLNIIDLVIPTRFFNIPYILTIYILQKVNLHLYYCRKDRRYSNSLLPVHLCLDSRRNLGPLSSSIHRSTSIDN